MNFVCDEGVERPIVDRLRKDGHNVIYIAEDAPSADDDAILAQANSLGAPLVTTDKDFGELVFRQGLATAGVVLVRLAGLSNQAKADAVSRAFSEHQDQVPGSFIVISPGRVRIRRRLAE